MSGENDIPQATSAPDAEDVNEDTANAWEIDMSQVTVYQRIGQGAFGSVYLGKYEGSDVAVKFINLPERAIEDEKEHIQKVFKQEVGVWKDLSHPNVVQFVGASFKGERVKGPPEVLNQQRNTGQPMWAIVTEYLSAGTLKKYLIKRNFAQLPLDQVLCMALDAARGLEYLHSKGIIHRDVKPDNLLLTSGRPYPILKIADFGVARSEPEDLKHMTMNTGTVRWMAPEIFLNQPYSRKVDVYSFGIVLWELYNARPPYAGMPETQVASRVATQGLRPSIPEECPEPYVELMKDCWNEDPEKRPEFKEVVQRLEAMRTDPSAVASEKRGGGCLCT